MGQAGAWGAMKNLWSDKAAKAMVARYARAGIGRDLALRVYTSRRARPIRPVFDSDPHRSTSGVPTWLDSACGMLTVIVWSMGYGKEKPRYHVGTTGFFWLRGQDLLKTLQ